VKKVLVIRLSSLGDVILASSVIDPLIKNGYAVDFMTYDQFEGLFAGDRRINRVIAVKKEDFKNLKGIKKLSSGLEKYHYILDLQKNLKTLAFSLFLKSKVIRYRKYGIKRRLYTVSLFRKLIKLEFNVVQAYGECLTPLGIREARIRPLLFPDAETVGRFQKELPEKLVVLGTGARYKNKVYPYYPELAETLISKGFNIALVGGEGDRKYDKKGFPKGVIDFRGKLSVEESLALISLAIGTVSNDSAVAHMSRAVKTPVVMVYGATSPAFGFYPFPDEGVYLYKGLQCQPCDIHGKKECKRKNPECLEFPPDFVADQLIKVMKKSL